MSQPNGQDEPEEGLDKRAGPPESISEIVAQIMAQIDEIISILERQAARRG
jgi:hypothetical protein